MKMKKLAVLTLAFVTLLAACGQETAPADAGSSAEAETTVTAEEETEETESKAEESSVSETSEAETESEAAEETSAAETEPKAETYPVYADMDGIIFGFMSGVGAWETTLEVAADGSFEGRFYDMNMGETGEGFENGTIYESFFTGRFSEPVEKDSLTWTAEVEELQYNTQFDAERYIDDEETLHILTDPYGLALGDQIEFLLPGTPYDSLSEEFLSWVHWQLEEGKDLPETAIYNTTGEYVFLPDHYAMGDITFPEDIEDETGSEAEISAIYEASINAYANQEMPDYFVMPYVPLSEAVPAKPYQSVTESNLQGRWVNRYKEGGSEIEEILSVNGDRARIECYRDGIPTLAWNGEGTISIEDRSDRGLCPAFRIHDDKGENVCTIYIRWVKDEAFYDGGFLNQWKRETPEDPSDQYLYDTVNLENLQGLWYSEYEDSAGIYMTLLNIDGDKGWIFETVDGQISDVWNGEGPVSLVMENFMSDLWYPELLLKRTDGPAAGGTAGVYITSVEEDRFYDVGLKRWYIRIGPDYGTDLQYLYEPSIQLFDDGSAMIDGENHYLIKPGEDTDKEGAARIWTVEVTLPGGARETISHTVDQESIYVPHANDIIAEADVNFDDLTDVLLYRGTLGPTGVQSYDCYINQGDTLVICDGFDKIPDPDLDPASRQVTGHIRDGANAYYELFYNVRGTSAVLSEEVRYEYDEELEDYVPKS